jgi:hypothetical protein
MKNEGREKEHLPHLSSKKKKLFLCSLQKRRVRRRIIFWVQVYTVCTIVYINLQNGDRIIFLVCRHRLAWHGWSLIRWYTHQIWRFIRGKHVANQLVGANAKSSTATAIPFKYSFSGNSAASAPISTSCVFERFIYSQDQSTYILQQNSRPIVGTYNSLTDTWMWKLGLRPRYSFSGNICFKFSAFCLCSEWQTRSYLRLESNLRLLSV